MQRIIKLISRLPDPDVRMRRVGAFFGQGDPVMIASAVEESALNSASAAHKTFYLALAQLLFTIRPRPPLPAGPLPLVNRDLLPDDLQIARIIGAAQKVHAPFCAALLRELYTRNDKYDDKPLPLHLSIEHLSLGVRRERARSPKRAVFAPLLLETTPSVVQLLAGNTRMREPDLVALTALRPTHPYALWAVLLYHRWLASDAVREACARNPAAKPWLVLTLSPLLGAAKLRGVVRKTRLTKPVLQAMLALYGGSCEDIIREALARDAPSAGPLVFAVDETFEEAMAFMNEQRRPRASEDVEA